MKLFKVKVGSRINTGKGPRTVLPAVTWPLRWERGWDENDNTTLEAVGGSTDGESSDLYYRLRQELRNDMHVWVEDSSPELIMGIEGPLTWHKKGDAMRWMQEYHDEGMRDCQPAKRARANR